MGGSASACSHFIWEGRLPKQEKMAYTISGFIRRENIHWKYFMLVANEPTRAVSVWPVTTSQKENYRESGKCTLENVCICVICSTPSHQPTP